MTEPMERILRGWREHQWEAHGSRATEGLWVASWCDVCFAFQHAERAERYRQRACYLKSVLRGLRKDIADAPIRLLVRNLLVNYIDKKLAAVED